MTTRCVDGRLIRHDPQTDDPYFETDIGQCQECKGKGCFTPKYIDIVFDDGPGPESGRFIEVENNKGRSIEFGKWIKRPDGYWALRFYPAEYAN